jgi:hypothetical protein
MLFQGGRLILDSMRKTFKRKELAAANELSSTTIARREHVLGLDQCRDRTCKRPIRYLRAAAAQRLLAAGYQVPAD